MTDFYSADSAIEGRGLANAGDVAAWFEAHTAGCPASEIGAAVADCAERAGVNGDLIAAQIAHETGWWSSDWARANNPAGLGVTGAASAGLRFPSVAAGIRAQVAHLLTYVEGADNPWRELDPRYGAAAQAGYLGIARTLGDLDGRWAVPGVGYGAAVARLANDLVGSVREDGAVSGHPGGAEWPTARDLGVPYSTEPADADVGPERQITDVKWFVVHTTEGHRASDLAILEHADPAQASVHFWISLAGGVVGVVPIGRTAWTVANQAVDVVAINCELEGFARDGATEAQYRALAAVFRWCRTAGMTVPAEYVGRDERPGIIGHMDVADPYKAGRWGGASNHTDPGPLFKWDHLVDLIEGRAAAAVVRRDPVTGFAIAGGFRAYYEWLEERLGADDALLDVGRPISDELVEDGLTVQYFERAVFERHAGARPARWDVLRRRLGADVLSARRARWS